MEVLYIEKENTVLHKQSEHLILKRQGRTIESIPLIGVRTIILLSNCQMTSQALELIFQKKIDVIYMSKNGKIKSRLLSLSGGGAILRLAQHQTFLSKSMRSLTARSIVQAKIHNQMKLISKYKRYYSLSKYEDILRQLQQYSNKVAELMELDEIMGFEGISAKLFWRCYRELLNQKVFVRREYRPAPDYINSALNLGYSFLANEVTTCLCAENFDLEIGFLHSVFYGRNSLTLDIMEEFRTPFIDAWILKIFNLNILNEKYFENENFYLNEKGFKKFVEQYHRHMEEGKWRQKFRLQAKKLKDAVIQGEPYEPYLWE